MLGEDFGVRTGIASGPLFNIVTEEVRILKWAFPDEHYSRQ